MFLFEAGQNAFALVLIALVLVFVAALLCISYLSRQQTKQEKQIANLQEELAKVWADLAEGIAMSKESQKSLEASARSAKDDFDKKTIAIIVQAEKILEAVSADKSATETAIEAVKASLSEKLEASSTAAGKTAEDMRRVNLQISNLQDRTTANQKELTEQMEKVKADAGQFNAQLDLVKRGVADQSVENRTAITKALEEAKTYADAAKNESAEDLEHLREAIQTAIQQVKSDIDNKMDKQEKTSNQHHKTLLEELAKLGQEIDSATKLIRG